MGKIEILLEKLDNRITSSLAKRLDTLDDLSEKLEASGEDYEKIQRMQTEIVTMK